VSAADPPALELRTREPSDTSAVGAAVATVLRRGDAVALSGELGAGKTVFVQGAAGELGVTGRVTSPTFTLVRTYLGARIPVVHCDVYRLDRLHDLLELGDDVLATDVVTFVEWGDAVAAMLPDDRLEVELAHDRPTGELGRDGEAPGSPRRVTLRLCGRWAERHAEVVAACAPWRIDGAEHGDGATAGDGPGGRPGDGPGDGADRRGGAS
jgi:tRNA threonylcarbamoyladenosine biosynthesis protein TsaE